MIKSKTHMEWMDSLGPDENGEPYTATEVHLLISVPKHHMSLYPQDPLDDGYIYIQNAFGDKTTESSALLEVLYD